MIEWRMKTQRTLVVLAVNDDRLLATVVSGFETQEFVTWHVRSAETLYRLLLGHSVDVVLIDEALPAAGQALEVPRRIPLVGGIEGAQAFGSKPFSGAADAAAYLASVDVAGIVLLCEPHSVARAIGGRGGAVIYQVKGVTGEEVAECVRSVAADRKRKLARWRLRRTELILSPPGGAGIALTFAEWQFLFRLACDETGSATRLQMAEALTELAGAPGFEMRRLDTLLWRLRKKVRAAAGVDLPVRAVYARGFLLMAAIELE